MDALERFIFEELGKRFNLKEKLIGSIEEHLVTKVSQVALENGVKY